MIPAIGIMIGTYIMMRSFEIGLTERKNFGFRLTMAILSGLTVVVTWVCMKDLITAGTKGAEAFRGLGGY